MANHLSMGAATGDPLARSTSVHSSGLVYYVDSATGDSGNSGLSALDPFDSLETALGAGLSGDDIIALADNHAETLATGISLPAGTTIVGMGTSGGIPTPTITIGGLPITVAAAGVSLRGVRLALNGSTSSMVDVSGAGFWMADCYVSVGTGNNGAVVTLASGADNACIERTTFLSDSPRETAASSNDPPSTAITVSAAISDLALREVVFDGGTIGWGDYAFKATAAAITRLRAEQISLLRGADYAINASTTGYFSVDTKTGAAGGSW